MRLDLAHRVERDADDDHERGAAEARLLHAHRVGDDDRDHADRCHIHRAAEGNPLHDAVDVVRRLLSRANAGDVRLLLLQVLGHVDGLERDVRVEVAEEEDQQRVARGEEPAAAVEELTEQLPTRDVEARERRGEREQRGGEDRRDGARGVHLQRQVRFLPAVHPAADLAARVHDRDLPATILEEGDHGDRADHEREERGHVQRLDVALVRGEVTADEAWDAGDDAGEDEKRDAVRDAALGDLLTDPHQERGAGRQRQHRHQLEAEARVNDDAARLACRDALGELRDTE